MTTTTNNKPYYILVLIAIATAVLMATMFTGCYTPNKAQKQVQKALTHFPAIVAETARTAFPCAPVANDTTIVYTDTTIEANCPDPYFTVHDTVRTNFVQTKTVKVPVSIPQKVVTIVKTVEDSAKLFLQRKAMQGQIDDITTDRDSWKKSAAEWEDKADTRGRWNLWLIILLLAALGFIYYQLKRK